MFPGPGPAIRAFAPLLLAAGTVAQPASNGPAEVRRTLAAMGTELRIEARHANRSQAVAATEAARRAVAAVERRLSTWTEDSELARLNRAPAGRVVPISAELASDLRAAREWWEATGGAFDPGIGALVAAWGLRVGGRQPTAAEIREACAHGFAALHVRGRTARWTQAGVRIEEGGFAKGIALDVACTELVRHDALGVVDLGGQLAATAGSAWSCSIADPNERAATLATLELCGGSTATSGNGERGLVVDGERMGHLLDPRTGQPAPDFGSLTVWAASAVAADCLSTGLYVLGPDAALRWANARGDVEIVIVDTSGEAPRLRATAGLERHLRARDGLEIEFVGATPASLPRATTARTQDR